MRAWILTAGERAAARLYRRGQLWRDHYRVGRRYCGRLRSMRIAWLCARARTGL